MYFSELKNYSLENSGESSFKLTKRQLFLLKKMDIDTLFDLINYFPFRYEDRSKIESIQDGILHNKPVTIIARVIEHGFIYYNGRRHPKIIIEDNAMRASLIGFNREYLKTALQIGGKYWISAQFVYKYNEIQASSFDFEEFKEEEISKNFGIILPIYVKSENFYLKELRNIIKKALDFTMENLDDEIPYYVLKNHNLISKKKAIQNIHFPADDIALKKAKLRLAYEEFLSIQLAVMMKKHNMKSIEKTENYSRKEQVYDFINSLPYKLTGAQSRVLEEIFSDMNSGKAMHRLLQGDVGCGKTTVALAAMIYAAENGFQSALMVPTEVLAIQHYETIRKSVEPLGIKSVILSGRSSTSEKEELYKDIREGKVKLIIGTHALIQEPVQFMNLRFIVFDEQHKFGVEQRISLAKKGNNPDILVMTATPIPRTLTLTLYGDLDLSVIDEMPSDRKRILTKWIQKKNYHSMLRFVENELKKGRQAYFVYPLIEESEFIEAENAVRMAEILKSHFPENKIGLLHGKLLPLEKYQTMDDFRNKKIDILVSTTVIEVGIDVKNATVMTVEGAERFGLSQLHQLRGRVGRGEFQSYCVLITGNDYSEETKIRMQAMVKYSDGFKIAEEDLKLRGPGEILGLKQSGIPELKIADYMRDERLLLVAKQDAENILKDDPKLDKEINRPLNEGIIKFLPSDYLYSG